MVVTIGMSRVVPMNNPLRPESFLERNSGTDTVPYNVKDNVYFRKQKRK